MLIAIMGDTYAQASEQKDNNARITKLEILEDCIPLLSEIDPKDVEEDEENEENATDVNKSQQETEDIQIGKQSTVLQTNLYVVIADEELTQQNTWEGQLNTMKTVTEKIVTKSFGLLTKKLDRITERLVLNATIEDIQEREVSSKINKLAQAFTASKTEQDLQGLTLEAILVKLETLCASTE